MIWRKIHLIQQQTRSLLKCVNSMKPAMQQYACMDQLWPNVSLSRLSHSTMDRPGSINKHSEKTIAGVAALLHCDENDAAQICQTLNVDPLPLEKIRRNVEYLVEKKITLNRIVDNANILLLSFGKSC